MTNWQKYLQFMHRQRLNFLNMYISKEKIKDETKNMNSSHYKKMDFKYMKWNSFTIRDTN